MCVCVCVCVCVLNEQQISSSEPQHLPDISQIIVFLNKKAEVAENTVSQYDDLSV